uniref:Non-LTR retroelement reverse transcriptase n=1 Tax=Solanum tuberosum TaxID=4113 RepID=M1D6V8_SOLTU
MEKSNLFLAGMTEETEKQLLSITGFTKGAFPIRYLGLPLTSKRWSKMECHKLVDKLTSRIKNTYAGRLQIVLAVLFSIHSFWGSVFILPQSVVKEVDKKCRDYMWGRSGEKKKVSLVSWEKVCCPKRQGGLNIKGCGKWNVASVGKLVWQIVVNKESLWVKWVHGVYIKARTV